MTDKRIYQIGLTMINGVGDVLARQLLQTFGDAEAVFAEKRQTLEKIPGFGSLTAAAVKSPVTKTVIQLPFLVIAQDFVGFCKPRKS